MEAHQDNTDVTDTHAMAYPDWGASYAYNSMDATTNDSSLPRKRPADGEIYPQRYFPPGPIATPRSGPDPELLSQLVPAGRTFADNLNGSPNDYTFFSNTFEPFYQDPIPFMDAPGVNMSDLFVNINPAPLDTAQQAVSAPDSSYTFSMTMVDSHEEAESSDQGPPLEETPDSASQDRPSPPDVTDPGPSIDEQQWLKHKRLLEILYAEEGLSLKSTMNIMEVAGFLKGASEKMYKARFEKWKIKKNNTIKTRRPARKGGDSQLLSANDLAGMIEGVKAICTSHLQSGTEECWSLDNEFKVVENEWDDAFGTTAWFIEELLKNPEGPSIDDIDDDIKPMVEELGLFSLPTIFTLVFRMCDKLKEQALLRRTVGDFLLKCQNLSEAKRSASHTPLTKVLTHAYSVSQNDTESLASLIDVTFSFYIGLVNTYAKSESATVLSLVSFYLVYVNPESWRLEITLKKLYRLLKRSEEVNGKEDDATLDILGLAIFILQKTDKEIELVKNCNSMKYRIDKRRQQRPEPDTPLEGKLLERYLDVNAVLATSSKDDSSRADSNAMEYVEQYKETQQKSQAKQDGYGRVLDEKFEEMKKRFETTSFS